MHAHAHEVFGARPFVKLHQVLGVEIGGFPEGAKVLKADLGRVAVMLHVVVVLAAALDAHVAGVPVTVLHRGLRAPMRPDAEFGVSKPLGNLVLLKRFLSAHKGALVNLKPGLRSETPAESQGGRCARQYFHRLSSSHLYVLHPFTFKGFSHRMSLEIDH
jgi:hypothetical protein